MKYNAFISYSHAADGMLAPNIQKALHRLAKPWYKYRMLHVFRDETNLSATPHLWTLIENALNESEYFILLASPEAAASEWVQKEVDYWLANKSSDTFLIGLTEGEIFWDKEKADFNWDKTTALPKIMKGWFSLEPKYADFKALDDPDNLSLDNPDFKSKIAVLASALHNRSIGDLVSSDIQEHKRTIRTRNSAILILILLLIGTFYFGFQATQRGNDLNRQLGISDSLRLKEEEQRKIALERGDSLFDISRSLQIQLNISDSLRVEEQTQRRIADIRTKETNSNFNTLLAQNAINNSLDPNKAIAYSILALKENSKNKEAKQNLIEASYSGSMVDKGQKLFTPYYKKTNYNSIRQLLSKEGKLNFEEKLPLPDFQVPDSTTSEIERKFERLWSDKTEPEYNNIEYSWEVAQINEVLYIFRIEQLIDNGDLDIEFCLFNTESNQIYSSGIPGAYGLGFTNPHYQIGYISSNGIIFYYENLALMLDFETYSWEEFLDVPFEDLDLLFQGIQVNKTPSNNHVLSIKKDTTYKTLCYFDPSIIPGEIKSVIETPNLEPIIFSANEDGIYEWINRNKFIEKYRGGFLEMSTGAKFLLTKTSNSIFLWDLEKNKLISEIYGNLIKFSANKRFAFINSYSTESEGSSSCKVVDIENGMVIKVDGNYFQSSYDGKYLFTKNKGVSVRTKISNGEQIKLNNLFKASPDGTLGIFKDDNGWYAAPLNNIENKIHNKNIKEIDDLIIAYDNNRTLCYQSDPNELYYWILETNKTEVIDFPFEDFQSVSPYDGVIEPYLSLYNFSKDSKNAFLGTSGNSNIAWQDSGGNEWTSIDEIFITLPRNKDPVSHTQKRKRFDAYDPDDVVVEELFSIGEYCDCYFHPNLKEYHVEIPNSPNDFFPWKTLPSDWKAWLPKNNHERHDIEINDNLILFYNEKEKTNFTLQLPEEKPPHFNYVKQNGTLIIASEIEEVTWILETDIEKLIKRFQDNSK